MAMTSLNAEADVPPHNHDDLEANVEELAVKVIGPRKPELFGGGRYEQEGLVHKVEDLDEKVDIIMEQGIRIRLPWQLWAAIVGALGGLGVQLIDSLAGNG